MANSDFSNGENSLSRLFRQMQEERDRMSEALNLLSQDEIKRMQEADLQRSKWLAENQALMKDAMDTTTAFHQQVQSAISPFDRLREEQDRWREDMGRVDRLREEIKRIQEVDTQRSKWLAENQALIKDTVEAATSFRQQLPSAIELSDRAVQQFVPSRQACVTPEFPWAYSHDEAIIMNGGPYESNTFHVS